MTAKSNEKAKRPRVVPTLETNMKIIVDFEAGKRAVDIGREHIIPPTTVRTIVADQQIYKDVAKLAVPDTIKCLRTRESALLLLLESLEPTL